MRKFTIAALMSLLALAVVTPVSAADGCGTGRFRDPYGKCHAMSEKYGFGPNSSWYRRQCYTINGTRHCDR